MTGECRLYGNIGCLGITYLPDEYHIGVKAQYRPESAGKGNASAGVNLNLIDVLKPVLHRVFNGYDIPFYLIQGVE